MIGVLALGHSFAKVRIASESMSLPSSKKWLSLLALALVVSAMYYLLTAPSAPVGPTSAQLDFLTIMNNLAPVRNEIEKRAINSGSTSGAGKGVTAVPRDRLSPMIESASIQEDGMILARARAFGDNRADVVLLLIPRLSESRKEVAWGCVGYPRESVPKDCR